MSDSFLSNQHDVVRLVVLITLSNHRQVCRVIVRLFEARWLYKVALLTQVVLQVGRDTALVTRGFIRHLIMTPSDEWRDAVCFLIP